MPYVPRASWTEAIDSPMRIGNRTAEWDAKHFMKEEQDRQNGQKRLREYLLNQYALQWGAGNDDSEQRKRDFDKEVATMTADVANFNAAEKRRKDQDTANRRTMREGLDQQSQEIALRHRDQRLQEAREFNELKLRSAQQLCIEMEQHDKRKAMLKQNENEIREHIAQNARNRKESRDDEVALFRQMQREQTLQDVNRMAAQQGFLEEKQAQIKASSDMYERTAGARNRARDNAEVKRQDDDERRHNLRMDTFYQRREDARERQRLQCVKGMKEQIAEVERKREEARNQRDTDGQDLAEKARIHAEAELKKQKDKRQQEKEIAQHHLDQIAEKQRREKEAGTWGVNYGFRPALSVSTMLPRESTEPDRSNRVDAPRFVTKPLGRSEIWISDPAEVGPVESRPVDKAPPAARIQDGYLHTSTNAALKDRTHRMTAKWHEGLSKEDIKRGLANARRRQANHVGKYNA